MKVRVSETIHAGRDGVYQKEIKIYLIIFMSEFKKTSHAIIIFEKKVLLELRDINPKISDPDKWTFPGGRMWMGEDYLGTMKRELKEEISLVPQDIRPLGMMINTITRSRHEMYVCQLTPEEAKNVKLGSEGQDLKFFTYDEMLNLPLAKYVGKYIESYGKGVKRLINTGEVDKTLLGFDEKDVVYI